MGAHRRLAVLCFVPLAAAAGPARAQQQQQGPPRIGYVYPAGGRQGSRFEVQLGGQSLDSSSAAVFSDKDVSAKVLAYVKPMTRREFMDLRDQVEKLRKEPMSAEVRRQIAELREKMEAFNRNANPTLAEIVRVEVTIDGNAGPGDRELRLVTRRGLTNPLVFRVGQLPEFTEPPPPRGPQAAADTGTQEMRVTLPVTVNGRIIPRLERAQQGRRPDERFTPGDVDRYRFEARRAQRLVIAVAARDLIPYLADAVPGWFQATVRLLDGEGKELAYDDDFGFRPDPVLYYEVPKDGEYVVEIKDAIYRGREDFVYRISIGELPFVTSLFPLGTRAGSKTELTVTGWNLPAGHIKMDARRMLPGVFPVSLRQGTLVSNRLPFAVDALPEADEKESNDEPQSAQRIKLPVIVNGRIQRPLDLDTFRIEGRGGDVIVAEVRARRLDSPLDSVLKLLDSQGTLLALNDDHEDKASGLNTHHADSLLTATLPASGTYFLQLGDAQGKGGPEYAYRLRISAPAPDFELRVAPSTVNVSAGGSVPITLYALRKDGFPGEIALELQDAPRGFALAGAVVPPQQEKVRFTLTVPASPSDEPLHLHILGRATIAAREVVKEAVPAEDMMQAFAYRHLVPAKEFTVTIAGGAGRGGGSGPRRGEGQRRSAARFVGDAPVRIPAGGTARVQIAMPSLRRFPGTVHFELSEPPEGITFDPDPLGDVLDEENCYVVLRTDAAKVKPGLRGNLIVNAIGERTPPATEGKPPANRPRVVLGTLPALPFEIVQ